MSVYVNRALNMKAIKAIGFDMDFTLVRYHSEIFEQLTYQETIKKFKEDDKYQIDFDKFEFQFDIAMRGLILDKKRGNVLKTSGFSKVKTSFHGTNPIPFNEQQRIYKNLCIDINDPNFYSLDTIFSIAHATLFMQLVTFKDENPDIDLPTYEELEADVIKYVDICHRDGSIKNQVMKDLPKYIIQDPEIVETLKRLKRNGKLLWLITNSHFDYTKALMDYTFLPFLDGEHWLDLFDVSVTASSKPSFFTDTRKPFLLVDPETGLMSNTDGPFKGKCLQGGNSSLIEREFNVSGEEILYLGDHIFGDILSLKKSLNWRTALVIEELEVEVKSISDNAELFKRIDELMIEKVNLENTIDQAILDDQDTEEFYDRIKQIDGELSTLIPQSRGIFNPYWGEVMRAGGEVSHFAAQAERYACIYMSAVSDLKSYSSKKYFRPYLRKMPHENKFFMEDAASALEKDVLEK